MTARATPAEQYSLPLIQSRDLLVDVLGALGAHAEALTIVGAHAVLERTRQLDDEFPPDSTHDADIGVSPELLNDTPLLSEALRSLGLEEASPARPGVWGLETQSHLALHERLTIDLLAPAALAGTGRRAADVGLHGKRAVSKTEGIELALFDRSSMIVAAFSGPERCVTAFVAGHAALVCAKAYKLYDRLDERELKRNPNRLRAKDAGDLWRLMATSDPFEVGRVFGEHESHETIGPSVRTGRARLRSIVESGALRRLTVRDFGPDSERRVAATIDSWMHDFGY